jgi:predicted DNA-binding WGR domain protein
MAITGRYEFVDASSNKFWALKKQGSDFVATWGKIGSSADVNGDGPTKVYDSAEAQKVVASKLAKGYVKV